jgi:sugar lactone lactonase YvrE
LLWGTALWLWWVPVATVRFSVPAGDSLAGSWSEEASSIALSAVWGDLGMIVLLAVQWLLVPALAGVLVIRRYKLWVVGWAGATLGVANNVPWVVSQLLLVPDGADARWGHAGTYLGPLALAVPMVLELAAGLVGGACGLLLRALGRPARDDAGRSGGSGVTTGLTLAWVIGTAGLLGSTVAFIHVRSGLPVLPWAIAAIAASVGLLWLARRRGGVRLTSPAATVIGIFALSYASVVTFVAPWAWTPPADLAGSWTALTGDADQLVGPYGVAVDAQGNAYVADGGADRVLVLSTAGVPLAQWGTATHSRAESMAVDAAGDVYIGYTTLGNVATRGPQGPGFLMRKFSPTGEQLAAWGTTEPYGGVLSEITGLAVAPDGTVYAADWRNSRIIRLSPAGEELASWKTGVRRPMALASDRTGSLYVGYAGGFLIDKLSPSGSRLSQWRTGRAFFGTIRYGLAVDRDGTVYVADPANAPHLLKLSPGGRVEAEFGSKGDAVGQFRHPDRLAMDAHGNAYVADRMSRRVQKFTPAITRDWR